MLIAFFHPSHIFTLSKGLFPLKYALNRSVNSQETTHSPLISTRQQETRSFDKLFLKICNVVWP